LTPAAQPSCNMSNLVSVQHHSPSRQLLQTQATSFSHGLVLDTDNRLIVAQCRSDNSIQSPFKLDAAAPDPDLATCLQPRSCALALAPLPPRCPPLLSSVALADVDLQRPSADQGNRQGSLLFLISFLIFCSTPWQKQ
jgi:hypothetical protein